MLVGNYVCDFCAVVEETVSMPLKWQRYTIGQLDAKGKVMTPSEFALCSGCLDGIIDQKPLGFLRAFLQKIGGRR